MISLEGDRMKKWLYIASAGLITLSCILGLATLIQKGSSDGRVDWIFGLTFLSIPFLLYNGLTPHYPRAQRFSHPYGHASVDVILAILWFFAWALLASYVASGKGRGSAASDRAIGCHNFTHGTEAKCNLATANTIFGVAIMLCFCGTAFFSFKVVSEYMRGGRVGIAFPARQASFGPSHRGVGKEAMRSTSQRLDDEEADEAFDHHVGNLNPYQQVHQGRDTGMSFEAARVQGGAPQQYATTSDRHAPEPYSGYTSVHNEQHYDEDLEYHGAAAATASVVAAGRPTSIQSPIDGPRR